MIPKSRELASATPSSEEPVSIKTFEEKLKDRRDPVSDDRVVPLFEQPDESTLPSSETEYRAASRPSNKPLTRLVVCLGKDGFKPGGIAYHFFQYVHLDSNADFSFEKNGHVLRFSFAAMTPTRVIIRGRNLLKIMDYIQLHRMAWVRVADRDYAPVDASDEDGRPRPLIISISISDARTGQLLAGGTPP